MNQRENLLSLIGRKGYDFMPATFFLCPSLIAEYQRRTGSDLPYQAYFNMPWRFIPEIQPVNGDTSRFLPYFKDLKPGAHIDMFGVGHEPGSEAAKHMTYMRNPLKNIDDVEQVLAYPFPVFQGADLTEQRAAVAALHAQGLAAVGDMEMTIWEASWYIRGMENLMMDMLSEDPIAETLLDTITNLSIDRMRMYIDAGVDILFIGDDVGMQSTLLMSESLYCEWLKPRLTRLIREARKKKPDIVIIYHSCGFVEPLIPHLIEAGIDVLNPVQPECMSFEKVFATYKGALSFHGTIGTQQVMPFGTPEEVRSAVFRNLDIAGKHGGLVVAPTHVLEPEVPWENILAYVAACREYAK